LWPDAEVRTEPLAGGITNSNYRVTVGDEQFVLRVIGARTELLGIDRDSELVACALAADLGIGPELVRADLSDGIVVTRFIDGRPIDPGDVGSEPYVREIAVPSGACTVPARSPPPSTPSGSFPPTAARHEPTASSRPSTTPPWPPRSSASPPSRLFQLVSEAREAMWGVVQMAVSALEIDFEEYAGEHARGFFERLETIDLVPCLALAALVG
jgi:hypothetical protein